MLNFIAMFGPKVLEAESDLPVATGFPATSLIFFAQDLQYLLHILCSKMLDCLAHCSSFSAVSIKFLSHQHELRIRLSPCQ